ncbi:S-adenosyl-L-methionine:benzoic acid/salicylic acid carboxyl methyltransferase 1-like [Rutidosis leptorrhynchoides]|uniref:S-adenosyl-L-methionine:benzoic acid/salicylic acid carboxyl methyltransferase 1-like n=1 Tax=Rutidosis leptorrhynchoides TaxID=125765 RepID=UPI003A992F17
MEVPKLLRMNGGDGTYSYSKNSFLQRKVLSITRPIVEEALETLYSEMKFPKTMIMADLGCSSGPNTILLISDLVNSIENIRLKLGHEKSPNIHIHLNDLPHNDFNTIFLLISEYQKKLTLPASSSSPPCYFSGVPGSFYTRLFLDKSIHFVHSSYSLMWLSQVPEMSETNKGNVYMSDTSPRSVIKAYREQFQNDFLMFLKCRAQEVVDGGHMVLTILGRRNEDPCSKENLYSWDLLAAALTDMVNEGHIEEEKLESFNIPLYHAYAKEVSDAIEEEGSFMIDCLKISEVNWDASTGENPDFSQENGQGYNMGKCMRAVAEPLVLSHFGESVIEEVFVRFTNNIRNFMSKHNPKNVNITVSVTRKR